jgi:hypothetical protein
MEALVLKGLKKDIAANLANKVSEMLYDHESITDTQIEIESNVNEMYKFRSVAAHNKTMQKINFDAIELKCRLYARTLLRMYLNDKSSFDATRR